MASPFRKYRDNPGPQGEEPPTLNGDEPIMEAHSSLWRFLFHLDKRQAITDERVLFILRWMLPPIFGLEVLILGYLIGS